MAIRFYDSAIYEKIKNWVRDPNMHILGVDESTRLFQLHADETSDKPVKLPLIAISRDSSYEILSTSKRALSYDGARLAATEQKSQVLNAIPIKISYQVDIYTKYFAEADEYARNFIFNLINYPKVQIDIPYNNANIQHNSTISLETNITDNSNISERLISGQFTRMTIRFTVDDAYLFSIPFMENWGINYTGDIYVEGDKYAKN